VPNPAALRVRAPFLVGLLFGALAFVLVLFATDPPGPGLDPDAMAYLGAAVSLVRVGRYEVPSSDWSSADSVSPLTHFPPGLPTVVAAPVALGMSAEQAGRLVVACSALLSVTILVGSVVAAVGNDPGVAAGLALLVTPALLDVHLSVLSEPLFLACLAAALALMAIPSRTRPLALGVVAAAAALVRYAGISVPAAAVAWTLLRPARTGDRADVWWARARRAALVALPSLLLVGAWGVRNAALAARETEELAAQPAAVAHSRLLLAGYGDDLALGATTLRQWLAPGVEDAPVQGLLAVGVALLLAFCVVVSIRRLSRREGVVRVRPPTIALDAPVALRLLLAALLLLAAFVGELLASRLLVFSSIPFDERILAPAIFLGVAVAAVAGAVAVRAPRRPFARRLALAATPVALLAWGIPSCLATADNVTYVLEEGSDFASLAWRNSPTLAWVRAHGAGHTLFTNWPVAVYFHLGRVSRDLPATLDSATLAAFAERLRRRDGLVVAFTAPSPDVASPDSIARRLALRPVARFADGVVWEAR
jgi:hypothetical protein